MNYGPTLRRLGMSTAEATVGFPVTLVGRNGQTHLIAHKGANSAPTVKQAEWIHQWRGGQLHLVSSMAEALVAIGYHRRDLRDYSARKLAWNSQNPDATQREYLEAMQEIAAEFGLGV